VNPLSEKFGLAPNQFAILFETNRGIEAGDLGTFLKRAATLARREGAELRVIRFETGSLATIFEALKKSNVAKNAKKEFVKSPIASTGVMTGVVTAVATALIWAFDTDDAGATPIARAGACVVEEKEVTEIKLVTVESTVVLMDEKKARKVREIERTRDRPKQLEYEQIQLLADRASGGSLEGGVVSIYGELHFRPDGYRFLVPIDFSRMDPAVELYPDAHFRVSGEIIMRHGRPDAIVVHSATQI
jgi:hypothetical protein